MTTLAGFTIPRSIHQEVPFVNLSGVDIPANSVLTKDGTNTIAVHLAANPGKAGVAAILSTAGSIPIGVSVADTPNGQQGSMQISGFIPVLNSAAGAIADGAAIVPDTGGQVKTNPGSVPVLGLAHSAGAAQADVIFCQLMLSPTL